MDLRPLTYEEMCQMELMHAGSTCGGAGGGTLTATTPLNIPHSGSGTSTTTTMLPIMVIPTAMMPPGTHLINASSAAGTVGDCEGNSEQTTTTGPPHAHFYQLQPTHILATTTPANTEFTLGPTPTTALLLQSAAPSNTVGSSSNEQQLPQLQQIPQQQPQTLNILYTGTLKPSMKAAHFNGLSTAAAPATQGTTNNNPLMAAGLNSHLECATLPRNFQPTALSTKVLPLTQQDESDFEGSECGASVSTTTCIPHFRFGGCGVILQPTQNINAHNASNAAAADHPQVIGCASLSHMMGTFASAAGDAMHTGGRNLAGTLGRNRRSQSTSGSHTNDQVTQTPKRVSFKGVDLPPPSPEEMQMLDGSQVAVHNMDAFNNCSYMNFDHFMDYQ
uniref:Uncharacterized protein n=3 Tax=Stomoxys calcitrans TaxID=35570 RepID=A0A1I8PJV4_STOCA